MIRRSKDWKAREERGRAVERGDVFGAAEIVENNWGHGDCEIPSNITQKPPCRARHRRSASILFGGGTRDR